MLTLENVVDGEIVHQRCVLIIGKVEAAVDDHVFTLLRNEVGAETFPQQQWPLCSGHFKAMVILSPGINVITIGTSGGGEETPFKLNYVPLLQTPPLHLAILVARDSPLMMDCPSGKYGALSSTHSGLDAAIAKLRMTAYMWQALTAEDMRAKGLGRRSFRLDEHWELDTLSRDYLDAMHEQKHSMHSTAHVHLVKTDKTVAELRDKQRAQQNPNARNRDELPAIFREALEAHGGVFEASARPVVAGLILDSHFSQEQDLVLAHAAVGAHRSNGLSLAVMGSHLTYSWPRFLEEVPSCLLDVNIPGDRVCNDNGECLTMWEACAVGQGAFLHVLGHALAAQFTSGIMARGYSQNWPKCFLAKTAYSKYLEADGIAPVTTATPNDCRWDIRDAMRFVNHPHFALPTDTACDLTPPEAEIIDDEDFLCVKITGGSGIALAWLNDEPESGLSPSQPRQSLRYTFDELESRFKRSEPLNLEIVCMNGKGATYDLWKLFRESSILRVPGTSIRLLKKSVADDQVENVHQDLWSWAVMLKTRSGDGKLVPANKVDLRVGCGLDGAVVYYRDGSKIPCGPRGHKHGSDPGMGGHQARKMALRSSDEIVKVKVTRDTSWGLCGLRMHLANGKAMGALNKRGRDAVVTCLEPPTGYRIIGFFGKSGRSSMCHEFGIVSAPEDAELPDSMYDMPELRNTDGKLYSDPSAEEATEADDVDNDDDSDTEMSEDEDTGYDDSDSDDEDYE